MKGIINPHIDNEQDFDQYIQWLQSKGGIWQIINNIYMITSYDLVKQVLADENIFPPSDIEQIVNNASKYSGDKELTHINAFLNNWLSWLKGDDHLQWKKILMKNFHNLDLQGIVTQEALKSTNFFFEKKGNKDIVKDLIEPFITEIMLKTLAYNSNKITDIRALSLGINQVLEPFLSVSHLKNTKDGLLKLNDLLLNDKIFTENFIHKSYNEYQKEDINFLLGNIQFFIVAGIETSIYFLSRAILLLLQDNIYKEINWDDKQEVKIVTEELLRYISPSVFISRQLAADTLLGEIRLPKGSHLILSINAANRDYKQFEQPFRLNLKRINNKHIAFGYMKHICMGRQLSLIETNTLLPMFFKELKNTAGVEIVSYEYEKSSVIRGLKSLIVKKCH